MSKNEKDQTKRKPTPPPVNPKLKGYVQQDSKERTEKV